MFEAARARPGSEVINRGLRHSVSIRPPPICVSVNPSPIGARGDTEGVPQPPRHRSDPTPEETPIGLRGGGPEPVRALVGLVCLDRWFIEQLRAHSEIG